MSDPSEELFKIEDFVPGLRELFARRLKKDAVLQVAIPDVVRDDVREPDLTGWNRQSIFISDGEDVWEWQNPTLSGLFRGNARPPVLGDHPQEYEEVFCLLESHVLLLSEILGDRRDQEMLEIYSALRRRPDGRSLGFVHDSMWQAAALILGTRILSQAEFEAILSRLERSCRTFRMDVTSRNYVEALRSSDESAYDF